MEQSSGSQPQSNFFKEIIQFTLIALVIVLPIRLFIAQPFVVSGESMDPTFDNGNYLVVDELSYRLEAPKRGDVIVFKYPYDTRRYLIKRIIGLPGETLQMKEGKIIVKGEVPAKDFTLSEPYIDPKNNFLYGSTTVSLENDEYFVMGDNRSASSDSRVWGPLKRGLIVGRPILRLLPLRRLDILPGAFDYDKHS